MATTKQTTRGRKTTGRRGTRGRRPAASQSKAEPDMEQVQELLLQALETELGGVQVYTTAVECATNKALAQEWSKYLEQTRHHVEVVQRLCEGFGVDQDQESTGRGIVRTLGQTLVQAMQEAQQDGDADLAQVVAAECVTLAEVKDHQNWTLLAEIAANISDTEKARLLKEAVDEVEDEEDEHLYHTMGWARELWLDGLGLPALLPPPEERKDVKSAVQAARAKSSRKKMLAARNR